MSTHIYHSGKETLKLFPSKFMNLQRLCVVGLMIWLGGRLQVVWGLPLTSQIIPQPIFAPWLSSPLSKPKAILRFVI